MAFYDRRTLDGVYSVKQSARYIMNYRYAEERMMRNDGGDGSRLHQKFK